MPSLPQLRGGQSLVANFRYPCSAERDSVRGRLRPVRYSVGSLCAGFIPRVCAIAANWSRISLNTWREVVRTTQIANLAADR
jgi:hypothetical protein